MPVGAGIRLFGAPCQIRHELSERVRLTIQQVYSRQEELDRAIHTHDSGAADAAARLQAARADCLDAQRLYDAHLREHGCMAQPQARAAHS